MDLCKPVEYDQYFAVFFQSETRPKRDTVLQIGASDEVSILKPAAMDIELLLFEQSKIGRKTVQKKVWAGCFPQGNHQKDNEGTTVGTYVPSFWLYTTPLFV